MKKKTKKGIQRQSIRSFIIPGILLLLLIISFIFLHQKVGQNSKAFIDPCAQEMADLTRAQAQLKNLKSDDPTYKRAQTNFDNRAKILLQCQQNSTKTENNSSTTSVSPAPVPPNNTSDSIDIVFSNETGKQVKLTHLYAFKGLGQNNIGDFTGQAILKDGETFPLAHKVCNEITHTYVGDTNPTRENWDYKIQADYSVLNPDNTYSPSVSIEDSFSVVNIDGTYYCDRPNLTLHALRASNDQGSITITNHTSPPRPVQIESLTAQSSPFIFVNTNTDLLAGLSTITIPPYQSKNIPINNCQDHASTIDVTLTYSAIFSEGVMKSEDPIKTSFACKGQNTITITHSDKKGALEKTTETCEDGKTTQIEGCGPDGSGVQICTQRISRDETHKCINVNCGRCML
jgi:hypothetical protein